MTTLAEFEKFWKTQGDVPSTHLTIYDEFTRRMEADPELLAHRVHIESNALGMGCRQFSWMWGLIVDSLPKEFSFMEVGVHCGQVISLIELLAKRSHKNAFIVGVSTFDGVEVNQNGEDYQQHVRDLFDKFHLDHPFLIKGDSTLISTIEPVRTTGPFDVVFIDGSHTFENVCADIKNYAPMVNVGGLLVMDDSANRMNMPPSSPTHHFFQGIEPVSQAVDSLLPPLGPSKLPDGSEWEHVAVCLHDRVFRRIY